MKQILIALSGLVTCLAWALASVGASDDHSTTTAKTWWAIQPLGSPTVPSTKNNRWCKNPVDQFILSKIEIANQSPSAPADKRTLLRRVTTNVIGLLPTPQELADFEKDTSPDAFNKVIDRLLASPHYGERMARHWLDLVHYAESHGHDEDKHRPHAWPYRDYVIKSFNSDKPFSLFVQEQIAGDVLFPNDPEAITALGMLAAGPWDQSSQLGIMDGTLDKQIARYLDRDDMLTTVMSTFTSTTVHCARCHQHKFDPISMDDYYALQAVFAGVDRINRQYDTNPDVARLRNQLASEQKTYSKASHKDPMWMSAEAQTLASFWEKEITTWQILEPSEVHSSGGAVLEILDDQSVRSGGARPDIDTVLFVCKPSLNRLTALRLEILNDPALPHGGPGRQENGNLHLSEVQLFVLSGHNHAVRKQIGFLTPSSDYDQPGWTIDKTIDGDRKTAWGIFPQIGKSHLAVFPLATPLLLQAGDVLQIRLDQLHGHGHLIGRFRLSATDADSPEKATLRLKEITEALATPASARTPLQSGMLAREARLAQIDNQIKSLPAQKTVYAVGSDFPAEGNFKPPQGPRPVHVLRRGNVKQPLRPASPGTLSCISTLESRFTLAPQAHEGDRRAALARWLTHTENPLTWRSIANRLWQWHFGHGLVNTANDFGGMGSVPSHPELLDWLAIQLRDGRSMKSIQRLLLSSATYQQSSTLPLNVKEQKSDVQLFQCMPRTRLDAETVRDSMLQISGTLDATMYGPSIKFFNEKPGTHVTVVADYDRFNLDSPGANRRSIYRFVFRTVPDPLMDTLDCPDGSQLTAKRSESLTPLQALALLHHPFSVKISDHMAKKISTENNQPDQQIELLYQYLFQRKPSLHEVHLVKAYMDKHGLANTCRLLFNTNEYHFID